MRVWRLEALTDEEVGAVVRRALTDEERGLAGSLGPHGGVALTDDAFEHLVSLAGGDARVGAQRPRGRGRDRRVGGRPRRRRPRQPASRGCRGRRPATCPRLRPRRRRPLRHRVGVHQEPARQRPGRRALLAGRDDRRRRGSEVHRATADHQRVRGRRERRPACAVGRGRGRPGARLDRPAGGAVRPGAGDDLHRDRAEVGLGRSCLRRRAGRHARRPDRCRSRSTSATPATGG